MSNQLTEPTYMETVAHLEWWFDHEACNETLHYLIDVLKKDSVKSDKDICDELYHHLAVWNPSDDIEIEGEINDSMLANWIGGFETKEDLITALEKY